MSYFPDDPIAATWAPRWPAILIAANVGTTVPGLLPWAPLTGEDIRALDEAIDAIHSTQKPMELHQDQPLSCSWRRKGYQGVMFWPPSVMFSGSGYLRTYDDWYRDPERTVETLGLTIVTAYVRQVAISKFVARGEQEPKGNH